MPSILNERSNVNHRRLVVEKISIQNLRQPEKFGSAMLIFVKNIVFVLAVFKPIFQHRPIYFQVELQAVRTVVHGKRLMRNKLIGCQMNGALGNSNVSSCH